MGKPESGSMVYWRFKQNNPGPWKFGYVTHLHSNLIRLGAWNGDETHGVVVEWSEIEWRRHRG